MASARLGAGVLLALGLALAPACDNGTPVSTDPGTCVHVSSAVGVQLMSHGQQLFYQYAAQNPIGAIQVPSGGVVHAIEVKFLDGNADPILIAKNCDINRLEIENDNVDLIAIEHIPGEPWQFSIIAKQAGTTSIRVSLWHESHSHYVSDPISVTVAAP